MNINTRPWQTPNYVTLDVPSSPMPCLPVEKVDPETLSRMCDDFRRGVFKKAGKTDPRVKPLSETDKRATQKQCPVCWAPPGVVCYDNGMKMGWMGKPFDAKTQSAPTHPERLQ